MNVKVKAKKPIKPVKKPVPVKRPAGAKKPFGRYSSRSKTEGRSNSNSWSVAPSNPDTSTIDRAKKGWAAASRRASLTNTFSNPVEFDVVLDGIAVTIRASKVDAVEVLRKIVTQKSGWVPNLDKPAATSAQPIDRTEITLENHPALLKVNSDIRNTESGRLDVRKIVSIFGGKISRFAEALGVSSAAVSQTPDSPNYQDFLKRFEAINRIRPLLKSDADFAAWLQTPNPQLGDATPDELLWSNDITRFEKLKAEVEGVLLGDPS